MSAKIHKIDKDNLTEIDSQMLSMDNVTAIMPQHIYDNSISDQILVPFRIDVSKRYVPSIKNEEMMVVVREKVDATAHGTNETIISNIGEDLGKGDYNEGAPYPPWELPQGFKEIKGKN